MFSCTTTSKKTFTFLNKNQIYKKGRVAIISGFGSDEFNVILTNKIANKKALKKADAQQASRIVPADNKILLVS